MSHLCVFCVYVCVSARACVRFLGVYSMGQVMTGGWTFHPPPRSLFLCAIHLTTSFTAELQLWFFLTARSRSSLSSVHIYGADATLRSQFLFPLLIEAEPPTLPCSLAVSLYCLWCVIVCLLSLNGCVYIPLNADIRAFWVNLSPSPRDGRSEDCIRDLVMQVTSNHRPSSLPPCLSLLSSALVYLSLFLSLSLIDFLK